MIEADSWLMQTIASMKLPFDFLGLVDCFNIAPGRFTERFGMGPCRLPSGMGLVAGIQ